MYEDATRRSGLYVPTLPFTGFGAGWLDFDNDGDLDLFTANGAVTLREELRGQPMPFREKNLLMRNTGGNYTDVTAQARHVIQLVEVSRGAAFGDLDNDGDIDIVTTNNGGPARILENIAPPRRWIGLELTGSGRVNRDAIGAVTFTLLERGGGKQIRRVHTDSSYCSASDKRVHFGLGNTGEAAAIDIVWPDRVTQRVEPVETNRVMGVKHPDGH